MYMVYVYQLVIYVQRTTYIYMYYYTLLVYIMHTYIIHTYMYACMHTCNVHVHTCTYIYKHVCMYVCTCTYVIYVHM